MNLVAVGLVLLSALLHAYRDFLTKQSTDKQLFIWWYRLVGLVIYFPLLFYWWEWPIPLAGWVCIVATTAVHVCYWYTLGEAYQEGDLSLVYPIARSAPIFVLIWAGLVWREPMTPGGVAGVLTVVLGAYILQMRGLSWHHLVAPIRATAHNRGIRMAWLTALAVAAYSLIDDRGVSLVHPFVYLYLFYALGFLAFIPYLMRTRRGVMLAEWRTNKARVGLAGVIAVVGYVLALYALQIERVGYVTAVRQLSIVFGVILGSLSLGESHGRIRLLASLVMFVGMALIVVLG